VLWVFTIRVLAVVVAALLLPLLADVALALAGNLAGPR
jgi:hypothetical protein